MIEFDRQHIWHPYTSMTTPLPAYPVESADGVRIRLTDGRELIDGMSSWWCAIHGYNHPVLNAAAIAQLEKMSHVMFGGLTHEPAVTLAEQLIALTPAGLEHVFFADSGSVSVEVAIKMAVQYWAAKGDGGKSRLLTIRGGYHGDTFGAMAVCDPVNGMHQRFASMMPAHLFADRPVSPFGEPLRDGDIDNFESLIAEHARELAAVILEPIVQGAGGMWFYSAEYLRQVAALCRKHDVLLILDEIATGFGRTGRMFACEHAGVEPDLMCVGKALTGGYVSLAATLASRRVAHGVSADGTPLMHGPTFMGNPLAAAIAVANLELLRASDWRGRVQSIAAQMESELDAYRGHPSVVDVRVIGAIGVIEMATEIDVAKVQQRFVDAGVWIRPFGRLAYVMPPYIIDSADLSQLTEALSLVFD